MRGHRALGAAGGAGRQRQSKASIAVGKQSVGVGVRDRRFPACTHFNAARPDDGRSRLHHHRRRFEVSGQVLLLRFGPAAIHRQDGCARARHRPEHQNVLNAVAQRHAHDLARLHAEVQQAGRPLPHRQVQRPVVQHALAMHQRRFGRPLARVKSQLLSEVALRICAGHRQDLTLLPFSSRP